MVADGRVTGGEDKRVDETSESMYCCLLITMLNLDSAMVAVQVLCTSTGSS